MHYKNQLTEKMPSFSSFVLALLFLLFSFPTTSFAQSQLSRISKVERSDGKGVVIRYHLDAAVDHYKLVQPAPDLVQMILRGDIDTTNIDLPEPGEKVEQVMLYKLDDGFGVDIYLNQDMYFKANAYPDQNGKHLLVGLTETTKEELIPYTQQFMALNWFEDEQMLPEDFTESEVPTVFTSSTPEIRSSFTNVKDKLKFDTIVIDPGHGGHDPGNLGYKRRAEEKDVVLKIAKKLGNYIEEGIPGVKVIYTREDDRYVALEERGRIANRAEADLFISIHADAYTSSRVYGSSVFFLGLHRSEKNFEVMKEENQLYADEVMADLTEEDLIVYELAHSGNIATSERFAYMVEDQLKNRAQRKSRGVKQMGLVVLYQATMPAILVEAGFLTNPAEQRYLESDWGQSLIASAIYRAVKQYKAEQDASLSTNNTASANE